MATGKNPALGASEDGAGENAPAKRRRGSRTSLRTAWKVGEVWYLPLRRGSASGKRLRVQIVAVGDGYVIEETWERWARTKRDFEVVEDAEGRPAYGMEIIPPPGGGWELTTSASEIGLRWRRRRDWEITQ